MRVVCTAIRNPVTGEAENQSPWLQLDHEYDVLEVTAHPGGRVDLRLVSEDAATPALFDAALFMIVDGRVPATWEARLEEGGLLRLGPPEWMELGFWEAYFDREPTALEAYERGRQHAL
jgi:hypothetical protein